MKKLILLFSLISLTVCSYAQSNLDYILYYKICHYREANGLKRWTWDKDAWKVANSHSQYQCETGIMGHSGDSPQKKYAGERFTFYDIEWVYVGENCAVTNAKGKSTEEIADQLLRLWKNSPSHNDLLLSRSGEFAGLSCLKSKDYKWSHNYEWWAYATLNIYRQ